MRYLGVDFGLKKTGLALGDGETKITAPLGVVQTEKIEKELARIVKEEAIECIVLGQPIHTGKMQQESARQAFMEFARQLVPVVEIDERYTTKESQAMQAEGSQVAEDALAAQIILEAYFSEL